jgi:hypothetical protein
VTNTVADQPTAISVQQSDLLLLWQGGQDPPTRSMPVSDLGAYYIPVTGGTITGNVTLADTLTVDGAATFDGAVTFSTSFLGIEAGVFTNTQMNQPFATKLGGINFQTEYQAEQSTSNFSTDAFADGISVPSGSTVYGANAGADYANSASPFTNTVARYGQFRALAAGARGWGANFVVDDGGFACGPLPSGLQSLELDYNSSNLATVGNILGLDAVLSAGLHTGVAGISMGSAGGQMQWAISIATGAAAIGISLGAQQAGANSNSQPIDFFTQDASDALQGCFIQAQAESNYANLVLSPSALGVVVATRPISPPQYAVATLPAASAQLEGSLAYVYDATSNGGGALTGGGAFVVPAFCNGTTWDAIAIAATTWGTLSGKPYAFNQSTDIGASPSFGNLTATGTLNVTALATASGGLVVTGSATSGSFSGQTMNPTSQTSFSAALTPAIFAPSGQILANAFFASSDGRKKTNKRAITPEEGRRWVLGCQSMLYLKGGRWEAGVIAQDAQSAGFHEVLGWMDDEEMPAEQNGYAGPPGKALHIQENAAQAYLSAALRGAMMTIDRLESRLAALEAR